MSVGVTATMLASLLATVAAPAAFAAAGSTSVTGPVSIGPGATSAAEIVLNFTEGTTAAPNFRYPAGGFTATVQLFDAKGASTISFSGTPVLSGGPGSLVKTSGFPQLGTGTLANDQLRLSFDTTDTSGSEPFSITGLKIKSSSTAAAGAIRMIVTAAIGNALASGTITANTLANPTVVTTLAAHGLTTGDTVTIAGSNSTPLINGPFTVTVLSATTFSIPVNVTVAGTAGTYTAVGGALGTSLWGNGNLTISAEIAVAVLAGDTSIDFIAGDPTIAFELSGATTVGGIAGSNGLLVIDDGASTESKGIFAGNGPCSPFCSSGTIGVIFLDFGHDAETAISQNVVVAGLLASPGSVANGLIVNTVGTAGAQAVQPGETNQAAGGVTVTENALGTLAVGTVLTFKIDTAGVVFSAPPYVHPTAALASNAMDLGPGRGLPAACNLSFDRTSCSVTVAAKSRNVLATPELFLSGTSGSTSSTILIDLAASVAQGTSVGLDVSTSPAVPVKVTDKVIARVSRVIIGVGATPTIYINENDQQSGMLTLSESVAGQFKDASDVAGQNWFGLCQLSGETYTRAPWAVVTVGDLKLRSGAAAATSVLGTLFSGPGGISCVKWQVWSKSTVASTIEIRGSDAAGVVLPSGPSNGPRLSVGPTLAPGPTLTQVNVGTEAQVNANAVLQTVATNAVRTYRNQPLVEVVNPTVISRGSVRSALGNIRITETQAGQFKAGERIDLCILDLATPAGNNTVARFVKGNTADNAIVSTNTATGLLATFVGFVGVDCIRVNVAQQATGALGVITISNMWVSVLGDAPNANILVEVKSSVAGVTIFRTVSPARIGNVIAGTATSRLGATQVGAFTTSTKVATTGKYITFRFDFGIAAAGQRVEIWGATKTGNDWTGFAKVTARIANASGVVYYHIRQSSATWKSYRALWAGSGALTPARQGRWIP